MIKKRLYRDEAWLQEKYINEGLSAANIGRICGVQSKIICYWLRKFNIKVGPGYQFIIGKPKIHGDASNGQETPRVKLYTIWQCMKRRCYYPKDICYNRYGGRGIAVCIEWKNSYQLFKTWAFLNGYQEGLTIDRLDNDGNYEPNNCQFLTMSENSKKRRGANYEEKAISS